VAHVIKVQAFTVVYQPIVDIRPEGGNQTVGYEALSRFANGSPPAWFTAASRAGLRVGLELAAIRSAVAGFAAAPKTVYLALNASVETLCSPFLFDSLDGIAPGRVVLELPEDTVSDNYERTKVQINRLVSQGYRLAMDDLARGRIDLWYLVRLRPSIIKIDISMIRDVDVDASKQSLVNGLRLLGDVLKADVVAEGIERQGELAHLQAMGVQFGQGYLLGRPGPLAAPIAAREVGARHSRRPRYLRIGHR
jgi:EAL domain-containing protein (putative c-di-GMP-specific phosphodiesterase class I)